MDEGYLKRAGVLLFHPDPEQFITAAYVKIGYFEANFDRRYQDEVHGCSRPREWCTRGSSDPSFFSSEPVGDTRPKAAELQRAIIVVSG